MDCANTALTVPRTRTVRTREGAQVYMYAWRNLNFEEQLAFYGAYHSGSERFLATASVF